MKINRLLVVESSRNKYALALIYRLVSFSTALVVSALSARLRLRGACSLWLLLFVAPLLIAADL